MARRSIYSGRAGGLRTLLTVVIALLLVSLVVTLGLLLRPQQAGVQTATTTTAGRTALVCATGSVPVASDTPTPEPSTDPTAGGATPAPVTPPPVTPTPTPVTPTPSPSTSETTDESAGAPGRVAVVATGAQPTATPAPEGRLTASTLGSDRALLTVDAQGHGAALDQAREPVLLLGEGALATTGAGAVLSDNSAGPEAGLAAAPCLPPSTAAWFPGVASGTDDRTELVLSNPDEAQAEVDLRFYGSRGRVVVAGSPGVTVAAHASRSISLTGLVDVQGPLSVSVEATVGRVSAIARRIRVVDDKPAGADWVPPAAAPARTVVVPAVPGDEGSRELVVTNPSLQRATVSVSVLGLQGPYAPTGAEKLTLPPESTGTVELREGLAGGAAGVQVTADQPVTAAVTATSSRSGAQADIAVVPASPALVRTGVSAVATATSTDSELVLSNGAGTDAQVHFDVLNYGGVVLRSDDVLIAAGGSATRRLSSPAPSYVVVHVPDGSDVVGGVVLTRPDGAVAGLSTLPLVSPDVAGRAPSVHLDPAAGR